MNHGYTKLFGTLISSSVWTLPDPVRITWITMLALADKDGIVQASIPGLAQISKVSLQDCQNAVDLFSQADQWSRNKDYDGRRIEAVDGGWKILSYGRYKGLLSTMGRREYWAARQREARRRKRELGGTTPHIRI